MPVGRGVGTSYLMPAAVRIYTSISCPYCVQAKRLLDRKGVTYEEIDVTGDAARRTEMIEASGRRTVPQIFIGEKHVGGCDDLQALDRSGGLAPLLQAAN